MAETPLQTASAFAPASIGNVGVGFDVLGMAIDGARESPLGDTVTVRHNPTHGETRVVEQPSVYATEGPNHVLTLDEGVSVGELVAALNDLGVSARDMIAIFQAMREAGALHAELVLL